MSNDRLKSAQKALEIAVHEMEAALVANPLVSDPLMATAQVLEDLGRLILHEAKGAKTRDAGKSRAVGRSKATQSAVARPTRRRKK